MPALKLRIFTTLYVAKRFPTHRRKESLHERASVFGFGAPSFVDVMPTTFEGDFFLVVFLKTATIPTTIKVSAMAQPTATYMAVFCIAALSLW